MTTKVNGASMRAVGPPRVLVTGGSGFLGRCAARALPDDGAGITVAGKRVRAARDGTGVIPVPHVTPGQGETPAVIVHIAAARALGHAPAHDLKSGLATVWPEFSEAGK